MAFTVLNLQGLTVNIMSLGGIAVAIGTMVDSGIVLADAVHRRLREGLEAIRTGALSATPARKWGPSLFFSLLIITVSFLPVFTLEEQEGRLFKPLAFTKTWAMAAAALLTLTLVPVLVGYCVGGRLRPERRNPIQRVSLALYRPLLAFAFRFKWLVLVLALLLVAVSLQPLAQVGLRIHAASLGGRPSLHAHHLPGISITKAREVLQQTDRIIKSFPEVDRVFGKVGRADTATDPAPLSMIETTIMLKPESQWREGMTPDKLIEALDAAIQVPGLTNAWTMPIKTRIDMLSTGIKTPVGVKISGPDLRELERLGKEVEQIVRRVPGTTSVYAERVMGGNYLDFRIDRNALAVYGLQVDDVQEVIQSAIGGRNVTTTVEGLERYPVNVRYSRELRHNLPALRGHPGVCAQRPDGAPGPVGRFRYLSGPSGIKSENGKPNAWVYVDIRTSTSAATWSRPGSGSTRRSGSLRDTPSTGAGSSSPCSGARRATDAGCSAHTGADLCHDLYQHPFAGGNRNGFAGRSPGLDRGHLAALPAGLPAQRGRLGRAHRAGRALRGNSPGSAALLERRLPEISTGCLTPGSQRPPPGHRQRVRTTAAANPDDHCHRRDRADADHVEPGNRSRGDEANCGSPGRGVTTSGLVVLVVLPLIYSMWKGRGLPRGEKFTALHDRGRRVVRRSYFSGSAPKGSSLPPCSRLKVSAACRLEKAKTLGEHRSNCMEAGCFCESVSTGCCRQRLTSLPCTA